MKDCYKVLGVSPGAPREVIKAAYRALMKVHHPDAGGDPREAIAIENAYRQLLRESEQSLPSMSDVSTALPRIASAKGRYIDLVVLASDINKINSCPRECSFYNRRCRFKQQLNPGGKAEEYLRATTITVRVRSLVNYPQTVDFRLGRGTVIDQYGDFYHCLAVCDYIHPHQFKGAAVEMYAGTQATMVLWFPWLPSGRYLRRFVYKHKLLAQGERGSYWDEELYEINLSTEAKRLELKK